MRFYSLSVQLLLFAILVVVARPLGADVVITEFMADNDNTLADEDGDYSDWIELYNSGTDSVDLAGWYLADDLAVLSHWRFPALVLEAGEFVVVFASGKDRAFPGGELHTSFRLDSSGEYLALFQRDGVSISHEYGPLYPPQRENYSYGMGMQGQAVSVDRLYFSAPTPGEANSGGFEAFVADVVFSAGSGFFGQSFEVSLQTETPGAAIRFTTDGSTPSEAGGALYTEPVVIADTTVLRAVAFLDGYEPSYPDTRTYIFIETPDGRGGVLRQQSRPVGFPLTWGAGIGADYEMDQDVVNDPGYRDEIADDFLALPSMSIASDLDNFFHPSPNPNLGGIYSNPRSSGQRWERPCSMELIYPDGREGIQVNCGIRIYGGINRRPDITPKHTLRLLFKKEYGPGRLRFPVYPDSEVDSFDTLVLRGHHGNSWLNQNASQRTNAQYLRDEWTRETQLAMGRPAAHGTFMHLYLNGLYWGVYNVVERPTAAFSASYSGGEKEEYDALNSGEVVDGGIAAWNTMMGIAEGGLQSPESYEELASWCDIPNLVDYMIVQMGGGETDWDRHNWYASRRREPGSGYQFFCWDTEHIFQNVVVDRTRLDNENKPTRIFQRLKENEEFRLLFADHLHRHYFNGGVMTAEAVEERYMKLATEIHSALACESARWGDWRRPGRPYTRDVEWLEEQRRLLEDYFPRRPAVVMSQFSRAGLYPAYSAPVFSPHGGDLPAGGQPLQVSIEVGVGNIYYTTDGSDPRLPGGRTSPGALRYTEPLELNSTTVLKARGLRRGTWTALNEAVFAADTSGLRISELMYHPREPDDDSPFDADDFEFIEVVNTGGNVLDLRGVRFSGGLRFNFSDGAVLSLQPGEVVLIVEDLEAFSTRYDVGRLLIAGVYSGNLSNNSETVMVLDATGSQIVAFSYSDAWHPLSDGGGHSLELRDSDDWPDGLEDGGAWRPSLEIDGSPGIAFISSKPPGGGQLPGDLNQDANVDISDAISLLGHLFLGSPVTLPCGDGATGDPANVSLLDVNGDDGVNLTDAIGLLTWLFRGGPPPALGRECVRIPGCPEACDP
ncbi:MAG: lamin tail domain-containing protein [Planctomycetota bacterium]|nr:lamin tail domain-containing protein [Planctomycetota bacterium]